jgi:hypothetical protein
MVNLLAAHIAASLRFLLPRTDPAKRAAARPRVAETVAGQVIRQA